MPYSISIYILLIHFIIMSDYMLINTFIKPPSPLPTLPATLAAPLGITMRNSNLELCTISDNTTQDTLQCTTEIIKHLLNTEVPTTEYKRVPESEIYSTAFKDKSEELKKTIDSYSHVDIANEIVSNLKNEVLPNLTHNEHVTYDFDCISGELCGSHVDMLPSYDRRLQLSTNKAIYSIGKPSESSDLISQHKENELQQFEAYSQYPKSSGTIDQIATYKCAFSNELDDIKEQPVDIQSIKQFTPMLTLKPKATTLIPKKVDMQSKIESPNIDILDELISIQSVLPKQVHQSIAIVPSTTVSAKPLSMTSFDHWAIEDDIDVKDYKSLLPHPVLTFPFELDVFQKRSIIRVEQGHVIILLVCACDCPHFSWKDRGSRVCNLPS